VGMRMALLMPVVALTAQVFLYIPYVVRRDPPGATPSREQNPRSTQL